MALIGEKIRGHQEVRSALTTALQKGKLPSTLLFRGPEAVGKRLVALSVAQHLMCEGANAPCGSCGSCLRVSKFQHEGLLQVSTEETNLKLEDIQPIFDFVRLRLLGRARVIIVNDAHKLNIQAANRLLKTLEEPPPNTYFILITSQEAALPITIRSRCQLMRFGPLPEADLRELIEAPTWAYKACQGRMDLLSKLSQGAGEDRKYAFDLFEGFLTSERSQLFSQFSEFAKEKEKTLELFEFFDQFLRDLWIPDPSQRIHVDLQGSYERLQNWDSTQIEKAWLEMQQTRKSIEMNGDRTLNLENLWFRLQEISA